MPFKKSKTRPIITLISLLLVVSFGFPGLLSAQDLKKQKLRVKDGKLIFSLDAYLSRTHLKKIKGSGTGFSGELNLKTGKIRVQLKLKGLTTRHKGRDQDMHLDVLNSEKFPLASFEGSIKSYDKKTGKALATGTLQLHGRKKKNVLLKGRLKKSPKGYKLLTGFQLDLLDYGITPPENIYVLKVGRIIRIRVLLHLSPIP